MKIRYSPVPSWLPVSLWLLVFAACSSRKENVSEQPQSTQEMPKPGVENREQTDSLKKAIDAERARRRKNQ